MTDSELWELYERLNDDNRILHRELGEMIVAANGRISLGISQLLMQANKVEKFERLGQLNLNDTQIKSLFIVAFRNEHFEVCHVLKEKYGNILN